MLAYKIRFAIITPSKRNNELEIEMNKSNITKTIAKVNASDTSYSKGFNRLMALPAKARKSFSLAVLLTGVSVNDVLSIQKSTLENLTDDEFVNWLAVNA